MAEHFQIREVVPSDLMELAQLHVTTWNETYPDVVSPPTFQIRERQWREAFEKTDGSWFCFVVIAPNGQLIGFAKGVVLGPENHSEYGGELSKIYLLRSYHGLGLGRQLLGQVARRFLELGVDSMYVLAVADNPTCGFYEKMGASNLRGSDGSIEPGNYGWIDLTQLVSNCQVAKNPHHDRSLD
jgi:GNAT superfamily N-acetyltransferase